MSINAQNSPNPVLQGLFFELFNGDGSRAGLRSAPLRRVEGLRSSYTVMSSPSILKLNENGYDLTVPLTMQAPAREVEITFDTRTLKVDRRALVGFMDQHTAEHLELTGDFNLFTPAMINVAEKMADVHNLMVARLLQDSGNYGTQTDSLDLTDPTEPVIQKIDAAVRTVRRANGGSRVVVTVSDVLASALRNHPTVAAAANSQLVYAASGITQGQLVTFFQEQFGAELVIDSSVILDNTTNPAAPVQVPTFEATSMSVAAVSGQSQYQETFIHTPAGSGLSEDFIAEIYTEEWKNPRGVKVYAEALFDVEIVVPRRGFYFSVTLA